MSYARQQDFTQVDFVPAEFRGLARRFCRLAGDEEELADAALRRYVLKPMEQRIERCPMQRLRDGTLHAFANAWRDRVPAQFRIGFRTDIEPRGRHGMILEMRAIETKLFVEGWEDAEHGITIVVRALKIPKRLTEPLTCETNQHAAVGLHALGRRYQRNSNHSHAAVIADLMALAQVQLHDTQQYPEGAPFRISTPRGTWRGTTTVMGMLGRAGVCFNVRTFVEA